MTRPMVQMDLFEEAPKIELRPFKVLIEYYTPIGTFHAASYYTTYKQTMYEIHTELTDMLADCKRPGLADGNGGYHVLVMVPDHPHNKPRLLVGLG